MKLPPKTISDAPAQPSRRRAKPAASQETKAKSTTSVARQRQAHTRAVEQRDAAQAVNTKTARHRAREAQASARALLPKSSAQQGVTMRPPRASEPNANQRSGSGDKLASAWQSDKGATPSARQVAYTSTKSSAAPTAKQSAVKAMVDDEQTSSKSRNGLKTGVRRHPQTPRNAVADRKYVPPGQHIGLVPSHLRVQNKQSRTPARLTSVKVSERTKAKGRPSPTAYSLTSGETEAVEASERLAETLEENRYRPRDKDG